MFLIDDLVADIISQPNNTFIGIERMRHLLISIKWNSDNCVQHLTCWLRVPKRSWSTMARRKAKFRTAMLTSTGVECMCENISSLHALMSQMLNWDVIASVGRTSRLCNSMREKLWLEWQHFWTRIIPDIYQTIVSHYLVDFTGRFYKCWHVAMLARARRRLLSNTCVWGGVCLSSLCTDTRIFVAHLTLY